MIQFESRQELKIFRLLDADPRVLGFTEQPLTIHYWLDGVERKHHPDVLVHFSTHKELWEVKPEQQADDSEFAARTELLSAEMPHLGYMYRVVVPDDIATDAHYSNAATILKYGRTPISDIDRERIRRIIAPVGTITWGVVEKGALGRNGRRFVCRLILEGVMSFDFRQPLHHESAFVWVGDATQGSA